LTKRGYSVTGVATADEAMDLVKQTKFDLVILDIYLVASNGLDLISPIKEAQPSTSVVILTGLGKDDTLVSRAFSEGAVGYIVKTQPLNQMLAEIRQHLKES
jgi:DNA-binding response OmpR family regulator